MRRENGTGTITKLSGKRRRPYIAKYLVGKNEDGNRRYVIVGYFATKKEASLALAKFSFNPDPMSLSNLTFAEGFELVKENWFLRLKANSVSAYENAYKLCQEIYSKPIRGLKTLHYQHVVDNCKAKSKTARSLVKRVMCKVCEYAVQNDIVQKNYARFVVVNGSTREKQQIYSDDEIQLLFSDNSDIAKQLLMLIYSGFRISEFANLRKSDIDLTNMTITGGTKTKAGTNRVVPIHRKTYDFWKEFYDRTDDILFPNTTGGITHAVTWRYKFHSLHERLNIPYRSPHAARHTCASIMARDGVNPLYIKEILGHKRYSFTADRYTHVDTNTLVNEMNKVN